MNRPIGALAALTLAVATTLVGPQGPANAVPNMSRHYATTNGEFDTLKSLYVECPRGTKILGGGARISGGDGEVFLTQMEASEGTNRFLAEARKEFGPASQWSLQAWSICGQEPFGLVHVSAESEYDDDVHKPANVACPAGKVSLSHGFRIIGGDGKVMIGGFGPTVGLNGTKGYATVTEAGPFVAGDWKLKVTAVCASPWPE